MRDEGETWAEYIKVSASYVMDEQGFKARAKEAYCWFVPMPVKDLFYAIKDPRYWWGKTMFWNDRPRKIGDEVMYYAEGPFKVIGFNDPENEGDLTIDYNGTPMRMDYGGCGFPANKRTYKMLAKEQAAQFALIAAEAEKSAADEVAGKK